MHNVRVSEEEIVWSECGGLLHSLSKGPHLSGPTGRQRNGSNYGQPVGVLSSRVAHYRSSFIGALVIDHKDVQRAGIILGEQGLYGLPDQISLVASRNDNRDPRSRSKSQTRSRGGRNSPELSSSANQVQPCEAAECGDRQRDHSLVWDGLRIGLFPASMPSQNEFTGNAARP